MSLFNRTAIYCKEGGVKRRIPWDLINFNGKGFISPMPITLNPFGELANPNTGIMDVQDLMYDDDTNNSEIDPVVGEVVFDSENAFVAHFEGVVGYYDGDETQSLEFGYPRS